MLAAHSPYVDLPDAHSDSLKARWGVRFRGCPRPAQALRCLRRGCLGPHAMKHGRRLKRTPSPPPMPAYPFGHSRYRRGAELRRALNRLAERAKPPWEAGCQPGGSQLDETRRPAQRGHCPYWENSDKWPLRTRRLLSLSGGCALIVPRNLRMMLAGDVNVRHDQRLGHGQYTRDFER